MRTVLHLVVAVALVGAIAWGTSNPSTSADPPRVPAPSLPPVDAKEVELGPEEHDNVAVYEKVNRSVVNITAKGMQQDDFLLVPAARTGSGSGSVLTKQGHILTNYHVVEDATVLSVTLFDGSAHAAKVVGTDPSNDLAVIKINAPADKLVPIPWGDSNKVLVGMRVFAIGNPFGLERTLTTGIVSSLNRTLRTDNDRLVRGVIQTDAAINPGNSGGPLMNRRGELIGITTAIVGRANQSSGIGLAVPANTARRVVEELIKFGRLIRPDTGILTVFQTNQGLLVGRLAEDGPAERGGLRGPEVKIIQRAGTAYRTVDRSKADLIVGIEGKRVKTLDDLLTVVESKKPGDQVTLQIVREGEHAEVKLKLAESQD
ncbi:MAG TPA: trypsin-like peptidase domain-containing protein [Gemmataceae bacterium]|nr:trypsin-like peptidase domain-containing protein [Gemmataceae bacterium]